MACISICTEGKNLDTVYGIMLHLFAQELEKTDVFLEKPTAKQIFQVFLLLHFFVDVAYGVKMVSIHKNNIFNV